MIRPLQSKDISSVMDIWLQTNIKTHHYVSKKYWIDHYDSVKEMLPQAEVYVYEEDNQILGFIGCDDNYIAGIFVNESFQSSGIGKQLLEYVKISKNILSLHVYQKNQKAISFYQREGFTIESKGIDEATNESELYMAWNSKRCI